MPDVPLLEARDIDKHFGRVVALRGANYDLFPGEVHALVGDNGAGKSTLIKVISGVLQPDGGTIRLDGKPIRIHHPQEAHELGIETVYQDLNRLGVSELCWAEKGCSAGLRPRPAYADHR